MRRFFSRLVLIVLLIFNAGCFGPAVLVLEDRSISRILKRSDTSIEPVEKYTIADITLLPMGLRDLRNNAVYISVKAFSKNKSSEFNVEDIEILVDGRDVEYVPLVSNSENINWKEAYDKWYFKVVRLSKLNYSELEQMAPSELLVRLTVKTNKGGKEISKDLIFNFNVSSRQYSGY